MNGLIFENQAPIVASPPNRADIACFVGFVGRRSTLIEGVGRRNTTIPSEVWRWLYEHGWTTPPYAWDGPLLFRVGGLEKLAALVLKFRDADVNDHLSIFIRGQIEKELPKLLESYDDSLAPPLSMERALVSQMNELLEMDGLYTDERFDKVNLSTETKSLIALQPQGRELRRLNRLLLQEAYPQEIDSPELSQSKTDGSLERARSQYTTIDDLLDIPVPIDNWEAFDRLFAWDERDVDGRGQTCPTYMGAAIRSFFSQGGRKCYVVRAGDPLPLIADSNQRVGQIEKLIPGYPGQFTPAPVERSSWHGIGHIFGLPDLSFLSLPDLADLVGVDREKISVEKIEPRAEPEVFVECSDDEPEEEEDKLARLLPAPRCDESGYEKWSWALRLTLQAVALQAREVQFVSSVPIPQPGLVAEESILDFLLTDFRGRAGNVGPMAASPLEQLDGIASAFLQLAYPWVRTYGSYNLPESVESPDAVLVGILARNALVRGTFRSAASLQLMDVYEVFPTLSRYEMTKPPDIEQVKSIARRNLLERISLFGLTQRGLRLLSDVTTSLDDNYRPASINRLVSVIVRAARRIGEDVVFEPSGERLWSQIRRRLNNLLSNLLAEGALRGARPVDAFQVRCDRSTMSQNDIDNGRVVAYVQFIAAAPIEQITVVLSMDQGGQVSLVSPESNYQEAA
jgi:hypothetical protein